MKCKLTTGDIEVDSVIADFQIPSLSDCPQEISIDWGSGLSVALPLSNVANLGVDHFEQMLGQALGSTKHKISETDQFKVVQITSSEEAGKHCKGTR